MNGFGHWIKDLPVWMVITKCTGILNGGVLGLRPIHTDTLPDLFAMLIFNLPQLFDQWQNLLPERWTTTEWRFFFFKKMLQKVCSIHFKLAHLWGYSVNTVLGMRTNSLNFKFIICTQYVNHLFYIFNNYKNAYYFQYNDMTTKMYGFLMYYFETT